MIKKIVLIGTLSAFIFGSGLANCAELASIIHGMALDAKGLPINLTPAVILQTQKSYIQRLEQQSNTSLQKLINQTRGIIFGKDTLAEADQIWANALWIGWMADQIKSDDIDTIQSNNYRMLSRYASFIGKPIDPEALAIGKVPGWVSQKLQKLSINWGVIKLLLQLKNNKDYFVECKKNGVPLPPPFGSPKWIKETVVNPPVGGKQPLLINYLTPTSVYPGALTEVYSYTSSSPNGFCIALPIVQYDTLGPDGLPSSATPDTYNALGVICQSISTSTDPKISNSKACFWDNAGDIPKPPTGNVYPITGAHFISKLNLPNSNRCTDCHAGENAFIVHKGNSVQDPTPLKTAKDTFNTAHAINFTTQNNWYKPLVKSSWYQNPEPSLYVDGTTVGNGTGQCLSCHTASGAGRLPNILSSTGMKNLFKYCSFLLSNELTDGAGNPALEGSMYQYRTDPNVTNPEALALFNQCRLLPPPLIPTPVSSWLVPVSTVPPSP